MRSGEFGTLIRDCSVTGATSNPTIFAKAITGSDRYDAQLQSLAAAGIRDPRELFFTLALDDVREAARELAPAFARSGGRDGFVSFECTPDSPMTRRPPWPRRASCGSASTSPT